MRCLLGLVTLALLAGLAASADAQDKAGPKDNTPPEGFTALFNGKDLTGWQGLAMAQEEDAAGKKRSVPLWLAVRPTTEERAAIQKAANDKVLKNWTVTDGILHYDGKSNSLQTAKSYGNFELLIDWKLAKNGDSGIYLRGNPQVQMWDPAVKAAGGVGSGGLYNNQKNPNKPLKNADKPVGEWNTFRMVMKGDKVTIWLNGEKVVDDTPLENYWDRGKPLPARGPIELQHHGDPLWFKNVYIKELPD